MPQYLGEGLTMVETWWQQHGVLLPRIEEYDGGGGGTERKATSGNRHYVSNLWSKSKRIRGNSFYAQNSRYKYQPHSPPARSDLYSGGIKKLQTSFRDKSQH